MAEVEIGESEGDGTMLRRLTASTRLGHARRTVRDGVGVVLLIVVVEEAGHFDFVLGSVCLGVFD